jgi:signal transduction histidine kinase
LTIHSLAGYTAEEERIVRQCDILKDAVLQDFKEEFRITRTGYFIPGEVQGNGAGFVFVENPDKVMKPRETPDSWHELDLLYFAMYDREGKMLGYIQLDYPVDGKIPTKETMEAMEAFASIATIAIENSAMFKDLGEAKDQVKVYLDLLSHDVGNLVSPVNAYLEIVLGTTTLTPVQFKYLSSALEANRSMLHIIRNVRRSAQMLETSGVELVPMNLAKSVRQTASEAKTAFLGKKVNLRLNLPEQDEWVVADSFLDDVIYNLLTNSIKYDEHEDVIIDVETKAVEFEGKNYINLRIIDRAVGIPDDLKDKVLSKEFRKTARADRPFSQKSKGAGMGLSIVKALMDRYKGRVWIENRVYEDFSRGSIFNLLLPVP